MVKKKDSKISFSEGFKKEEKMVSASQFNFKLREESDETFENDNLQENEYNSLSIQNMLIDGNNDYLDEPYKLKENKIKKKDKKKRKEKTDEIKKPVTNRRIVNLPASQPYVRMVDGEERLCFKYNTKISEKALNAMPRTDLEDNEFCVRFDLDSVDVNKLNDKFKMDNCVYPRANVPFEMYTGNRWEYETECNTLAWQFVSLNPILLYGKKGLIQRAVDSYRNINKQSRGRRIVKQDHLSGYIKRRHNDPLPLSITIHWSVKGVNRKCKVRVDLDQVNYEKIDIDFKVKYSVYPDEFDDESFGLNKWESNNPDNITAVKIAYLNIDNTTFWNAMKVCGKAVILKRAVDGYKSRTSEGYVSDDDDKIELSEIVVDTLSKVYDDHKGESFFPFDDMRSK